MFFDLAMCWQYFDQISKTGPTVSRSGSLFPFLCIISSVTYEKKPTLKGKIIRNKRLNDLKNHFVAAAKKQSECPPFSNYKV